MWKNIVEPDSSQTTIWRMRIACWIPKATNTHSWYVILTAFPLQQWLHERTSMLRYTTMSILFVCHTLSNMFRQIRPSSGVTRIKIKHPQLYAIEISKFNTYCYTKLHNEEALGIKSVKTACNCLLEKLETYTCQTIGNGEVHPRRGHEDPEMEQTYSSTLSLTSVKDGGGVRGQHHTPAAFAPGERPNVHRTRGSFEPQALSVRVRKRGKSPVLTGFRTPNHPAHNESLYPI
jgi:hypothetical protein